VRACHPLRAVLRATLRRLQLRQCLTNLTAHLVL
jgi:hypothetical protein